MRLDGATKVRVSSDTIYDLQDYTVNPLDNGFLLSTKIYDKEENKFLLANLELEWLDANNNVIGKATYVIDATAVNLDQPAITPVTGVNVSTTDTDTVNAGGVENTIKWTDSLADDIASYRIVRAEVDDIEDGTATEVATDIAEGTQTYTDDTAVAGTEYFYFVVAVDGAGNEGAPTNGTSVTTATDEEDTEAPAAVTGVNVSTTDTDTLNAGGVENTIKWTDSLADDIASYRIVRAEADDIEDGTATEVAIDIAEGTQTYTDDTAVAGTEYFYFVVAVDGAGNEGAPTNGTSVTTATDEEDTEAPAAVTGVNVSTTDTDTLNAGGVENTIKWTDSLADDIASYRIVRAEADDIEDGTATEVAIDIAEGTQTYTDDTAVAGTEYFYFVVAVDGAGNEGAPTNGTSVTTATDEEDTEAPAAVTGVNVSTTDTDTLNAGGVENTIKWTDSLADDIASYRIVRAEADDIEDGTATEVATDIAEGTQTYTDDTAVAGTEYFYFVVAVDGAGNEGAPTNGTSVTTATDEEDTEAPAVANKVTEETATSVTVTVTEAGNVYISSSETQINTGSDSLSAWDVSGNSGELTAATVASNLSGGGTIVFTLDDTTSTEHTGVTITIDLSQIVDEAGNALINDTTAANTVLTITEDGATWSAVLGES
ncbi:fibronectin type III domain-containing protein [Metabacillus endolithicus]|nr:hypothetical protein [Metabacillus endolithicus]UPG65416.1 hypothetical protein MVE64_10855 [Metabacillus endolithicus]